MSGLVFVPVYPELPDKHLDLLARVVEEGAADGAEPEGCA
jgi:hypothetical protein